MAQSEQPDFAELEAVLHAADDARPTAGLDAVGASLDALLGELQNKFGENSGPEVEAEKHAPALYREPVDAPLASAGTSVTRQEQPSTNHHTEPKPTDAPDLERYLTLPPLPQMQGARQVSRKRKGLAPYRSLSERLLIRLAHLSLCRQAPVVAFTLHVRPDIAAKAIATDDPVRYLAKALRYRLGSSTPLWFTLETTVDGILHLHGATTCPHDPASLSELRSRLRKAAGEWATTRQHQCKTSLDPDWGWTGYSTKDFGRMFATRIAGPGEGGGRYGFSGKAWYVTRDLAAVTKARYEEKRSRTLATKAVTTDLHFAMLDSSGTTSHLFSAHERIDTDALPNADGRRILPPVSRDPRPGTDDLAEGRGRDPQRPPSPLWAAGDGPRWRDDRPRAQRRAAPPSRAPRPP